MISTHHWSFTINNILLEIYDLNSSLEFLPFVIFFYNLNSSMEFLPFIIFLYDLNLSYGVCNIGISFA